MPDTNKRRSYAIILLAASFWGLMGIWNRKLNAYGISAYTIVTIRNSGALLFLTIYFALFKRSVFHVRARHFGYFFGTGVVSILLFSLCYFSCQQLCSLAIAATLVYISPSVVVILSAILWKEPITRKKVVSLILTLAGCMCVAGIFAGNLQASPVGLLLGVLSGFFFGLYTIFSRYVLSEYEPMTVVYWTFVFCGLGALFLMRPHELVAVAYEPRVWIYGSLLAALSTAVPYILYTHSLSKVDSGKAAILCSFEPIVGSLAGMVVFDETMSLMTMTGILLVLSGIYILR